MAGAIYVSIAALLVSFASLITSIYSVRRDRAQLQARCDLVVDEGNEHEPIIRIEAVNKGRRPLILRSWGGTGHGDAFLATYIDRDAGGKRLGEGEGVHFTLEHRNLGAVLEDEIVEIF